jgi:hypothetical protein
MREEGRFSAALRIEKDTSRGPLPDILPEMIDILRDSMVKSIARLVDEEKAASDAASAGAEDESVTSPEALKGVGLSGDGDLRT